MTNPHRLRAANKESMRFRGAGMEHLSAVPFDANVNALQGRLLKQTHD